MDDPSFIDLKLDEDSGDDDCGDGGGDGAGGADGYGVLSGSLLTKMAKDWIKTCGGNVNDKVRLSQVESSLRGSSRTKRQRNLFAKHAELELAAQKKDEKDEIAAVARAE